MKRTSGNAVDWKDRRLGRNTIIRSGQRYLPGDDNVGLAQYLNYLPLRGLEWTTPRAGVKTTPATERAFQGPRSQAGPLFFRWAFLICDLVRRS